MNDDTGGPAFPVGDTYHPGGQIAYGDPGMTLRDYFAGQALVGLTLHRDYYDWSPKSVAIAAYRLADAMLEERGGEYT